MNDVLRGRLVGYSVARLLQIINRLGLNIEIRIEQRAAVETAGAKQPLRTRRGATATAPLPVAAGVTVVV